MIRLECMSRDGLFRPIDIFKDESISMQFESIPVKSIGERKMPFSETFVVPLTSTNKDMFGITIGSISITNKTNQCILYNDDNVIFRGTFEVGDVVTRSTANYVSLNLYDKIRTAIDDLLDMTFAEYLQASSLIDADVLRNPAIPVTFAETNGLASNVFSRLTGDENGNRIYGATIDGDSVSMPLCFNTLELLKDMFNVNNVQLTGNFIGGATTGGFPTSNLGVIFDVEKIHKPVETSEVRELESYPCLGNGNARPLAYPTQQFCYNQSYNQIDNVAWDWSIHGLATNDIYKPIFPVHDANADYTSYRRTKLVNYYKGDESIDIDVNMSCFRTNVKLLVDTDAVIYPMFDSLTWERDGDMRETQIYKILGDNLSLRINYGVNGVPSWSREIGVIEIGEELLLPADEAGRQTVMQNAITMIPSDPSDSDHVFQPEAGTYYDIWFSYESYGTTTFKIDIGETFDESMYIRGQVVSGSGWMGAIMGRILSTSAHTNLPTIYEKVLNEPVIATCDYDGVSYGTGYSEFVGYSLFDSFDETGLKCSEVVDDILSRFNLGMATEGENLRIDPVLDMFSDIVFDVESLLDAEVSMKYDKDGIDKLSITNKATNDMGASSGYNKTLGNIEDYAIDKESKEDLSLAMSSTIVNSRMHGKLNSMDDGMIKKVNSFPDVFYFGYETYSALSNGSFGTRHCFISDEVYADIYTPILNAISAFEAIDDPQWRGYADSRFIKNVTNTRIAPKRTKTISTLPTFTQDPSSAVTVEFTTDSILISGMIDNAGDTLVSVGTVSPVPFSKSYEIPVFTTKSIFVGTVVISTGGAITLSKDITFSSMPDQPNQIQEGKSSGGYYDPNTELIKRGDDLDYDDASGEILTADVEFDFTPSDGVLLPTVVNYQNGVNLFYGDGKNPVENSVYSYLFESYIRSVSITDGVSVDVDIYISPELAAQLQERPKASLYADNGGNPVLWYVSKVEGVDLSAPNGGVYSVTLTKDL